MTVFLGDNGRIELRRKGSDQPIFSTVNAADIREDVYRFSLDFAHEQVITGDRLEITTQGGEDLTWIDDPAADNSFTRYAHVDEAGGIRLYDSFSEAIDAAKPNSIPLKKPATPQVCKFRVVNDGEERCLAKVKSYQITTARETIDTTNLGAFYRKQYESGLIQGQGQIDCFWDKGDLCNDDDAGSSEFAATLARLCLRLVHGAAFHGWFYIYADEAERERRAVWYECETCIVTNVAVTVSPSEMVSATIDFITSGPITLREGYIPAFVELEQDEFKIGLEGVELGRMALENSD